MPYSEGVALGYYGSGLWPGTHYNTVEIQILFLDFRVGERDVRSRGMVKIGQQTVSRNTKAIRNGGILLFVLSFLVPAPHIFGASKHFFAGCAAFIETPLLPFVRLTGDDPTVVGPSFGDLLYDALICSLCWLSWAANFTVFFRLPLIAALITVAIPWAAFIWAYPLMADFYPFYFWVAGIALIHLSRLLKSVPKVRRNHF